jgi:hypothetical protein
VTSGRRLTERIQTRTGEKVAMMAMSAAEINSIWRFSSMTDSASSL